MPLYGKDTGTARSELVEEVLRFESELYHANKLSARLLAATLIISNKLIAKDRLKALWEEIKMLDILEIAKEEGVKEGLQEGRALGLQEGKALGVQEGKAQGVQEGKALGMVETLQEVIVDTLLDVFPVVPAHLSEQIRTMTNGDVLKGLHRQAIKCQNLQDFEALLQHMS